MKQNTAFVISEFTNPSGDVVFRVSGSLNGMRIRRNFSSRAEADAERQILDVQRLQSETGIRTAATRLTDEQLKDAEAAFRRLADLGHSLLFCVDFAIANYRAPEKQKNLADAAAAYVTAKEHEFEQGQLLAPEFTQRRHRTRSGGSLRAADRLGAGFRAHHPAPMTAQQWVSGVALETRLWPDLACTTGGQSNYVRRSWRGLCSRE